MPQVAKTKLCQTITPAMTRKRPHMAAWNRASSSKFTTIATTEVVADEIFRDALPISTRLAAMEAALRKPVKKVSSGKQ